jgi:hypothetical protein
MPARVLVCHTFTISVDVAIKEQDLLSWLNSRPNLFDCLGQKRDYKMKIKSIDKSSKFHVESIENCQGKKLNWDGKELSELEQ